MAQKPGLAHRRGEVISKGSTRRFESKSSKRHNELAKCSQYLPVAETAHRLSHCYPKHAQKYPLWFWRRKARGAHADGGTGVSVPASETSKLFQREVNHGPWLRGTGSLSNGSGGSSSKGPKGFRSAQRPPALAASLVEAVGNTARICGSLSGQQLAQFTVCLLFIMHIIY